MTLPACRPFQTVLVANRGEIALRIFRTLRRLGHGCVAVYSEADAASPHVRAADLAVDIGGAAPRASYLNAAAIVQAARRAGADAIHPGYGFLAENADFADAVVAAGLVFIGPSGAAIRAMGDKAEAKRRVMASGMPCIPGYQGEDQSDATLEREAERVGYPIMVKATAGGGGRGMRLVQASADLPAALQSARAEALAAFGDGTLMLERALVQPRHVEIQLLADAHGNTIHLGERDCSVQRRHQKLIEEAPSPAVDAALRARMGQAAAQAARAIGYVGAGTMEFLLDRSGEFFFMEMNTRLQVEHAVTEAVTGLDLVEWQLRVAAGEPLTLAQDEPHLHGHAIEARLTAEDAASGFLPQTGPVLRWRAPPEAFDVRIDHALEEGAVISPYYDSMVAKLIAHGRTRDEARRKLAAALRHTVLLGTQTNAAFLADCLEHPAFATGSAVHTGFIAEHPALCAPPAPGPRTLAFAALACAIADNGARAFALPTPGATELAVRDLILACADKRHACALRRTEGRWQVEVDGAALALGTVWADANGAAEFSAVLDGVRESVLFAPEPGGLHLFHAGRAWHLQRIVHRRGQVDASQAGGTVTAPLTARVVQVLVAVGDDLRAGQRIAVLEAMKMEHAVTAPVAGRVLEITVQAGGQVAKGARIATVEPPPVTPSAAG
ncbi:MAG TPA: biotin carboxylase N-terminal domain-containing protein [Burkholderiaceae bacterium]|nr:biotin carboxylase N-terminal domain-containing protein [Burkholderiaceae bacterium]